MKKSVTVSSRIDEEMVIFEGISNEIDQKIVKTQNDICVAKEELIRARHIKHTRMEYTSLANNIRQYPPREKTVEVMNSYTNELSALKVDIYKNNKYNFNYNIIY